MTPNHPAAVAMFARVAALYGIDASLLWRKGERSPSLVEARQLAMWALRERTRWSYPELGIALCVDHTSVMHGVRRACGRAGNKIGTGFLRDAVKALGMPWGDGVESSGHPPPLPVDESVNGTGTGPVQVVAQAVICPPSLVLSPSAPPSGSEGSSADSGSLLSSDQRPVSRRARGWRFVPADWQPNDEHRKRARVLRVNLEEEVQNFREHEFKDPKTNADLAFFRWLKTAAKGFGAGPAPGFVQHAAHVESHRRPELRHMPPPRPVQEATPLEVLAHVGQVLNRPPAPRVEQRGKMSAA
jgi:hypothetical protein